MLTSSDLWLKVVSQAFTRLAQHILLAQEKTGSSRKLLYLHAVTMETSPAYRNNGDDADVLGVSPELVPWDDPGVVDQAQAEDQQAQQLHQHGRLQTAPPSP